MAAASESTGRMTCRYIQPTTAASVTSTSPAAPTPTTIAVRSHPSARACVARACATLMSTKASSAR
jgi:hypothetical protein